MADLMPFAAPHLMLTATIVGKHSALVVVLSEKTNPSGRYPFYYGNNLLQY